MYRYLLFAHRHYEAAGGMSDLVFKFDTVDELQKELTNGGVDIGLKYQDGFEIYDIKYDNVIYIRDKRLLLKEFIDYLKKEE